MQANIVQLATLVNTLSPRSTVVVPPHPQHVLPDCRLLTQERTADEPECSPYGTLLCERLWWNVNNAISDSTA